MRGEIKPCCLGWHEGQTHDRKDTFIESKEVQNVGEAQSMLRKKIERKRLCFSE